MPFSSTNTLQPKHTFTVAATIAQQPRPTLTKAATRLRAGATTDQLQGMFLFERYGQAASLVELADTADLELVYLKLFLLAKNDYWLARGNFGILF